MAQEASKPNANELDGLALTERILVTLTAKQRESLRELALLRSLEAGARVSMASVARSILAPAIEMELAMRRTAAVPERAA